MAQREFDQYKIEPDYGGGEYNAIVFSSPNGGKYIVDKSGYERGYSPSGYSQFIPSPGDTVYYTPIGSEVNSSHPAYKNVQSAYRQDIGYVDPNYVNNIPEKSVNLIPYNSVKPKNNVETYQGGGDINGEASAEQQAMYTQVLQLANAALKGDKNANAQVQQILGMAQMLEQVLSQSEDAEYAKCGTKLKKRVKKGKCGCAVTLKRVGGKLVNVDCNGNIVK